MNEHSIEVVIDVFIVIIGIAIERFFTNFPLGADPVFDSQILNRCLGDPPRDHRKEHNGWYWPCFVLSLIVIVTLALRFLIGSDFQLRHAYVYKLGDIHLFIWDICFLLGFGGFIVKAALAEDIHGFAGWLAGCSAVTTLWGILAFHRPDQHVLIRGWLIGDSIQFLLSLAVALWCWRCKSRKSQKAAIYGLIVLFSWYIVFFPFDLKNILTSKPPEQGTFIQCSK